MIVISASHKLAGTKLKTVVSCPMLLVGAWGNFNSYDTEVYSNADTTCY